LNFSSLTTIEQDCFHVCIEDAKLVCVEYAIECQILFNVLNAIWAFCMRAMISTSVPSVLLKMLTRYANCHSFSSSTVYAESLIIVHGSTHLLRLIYVNL